ncbi:AAA family ATPase [Evansella sp. LMS18]|uniref:ATP-binding protein n=1 Tax=Evansella sp. LMS18 TaxID=2924033 RepID=UPI0020D0406F|nr:AAA family ATPase [Evansella sp. LMS18]UTR09222.1 AAA family ATPase [Evansella sp. LMS18]
MKLKKVHIYGFGKWEDTKWELDGSGIQVFLGRNESGKSTFMAFIQAVLFGFPKKGENQYIPRHSNAYGGELIFETNGETVTVKRVKGRRAKGEVSVHLDDGRNGGEELLERILENLDLTTFRGIFHFDLDGLNGLGSLNPEDLNEFLYDAGFSGGSSITQLEKELHKEMEQLFKPRGKKTELNLLINRMQKKEQEIKSVEERLSLYESLKSDLTVNEENYARNKDMLKKLNADINELDKHIALLPLATEYRELQLWFGEEDMIDNFPQNGNGRLDSVQQEIINTSALLKEETLRAKSLEEEMKVMAVHPSLPEIKNEVYQKSHQFESYKKSKNELREQELYRNSAVNQMDLLEKNWQTRGEINFSDIIFHSYMKNEFTRMKEEIVNERNDLARAEKEKNRLQGEAEAAGKDVERTERQILDEATRQELKKTSASANKGAEAEWEIKSLKERLEFIAEEKTRQAESDRRQQKGFYILSALLLIMSLTLFNFTGPSAVFILAGLSAGALAGGLWKRSEAARTQNNYEKQLNEINERLDVLRHEPSAAGTISSHEAERKLREDEENRLQYKEALHRYKLSEKSLTEVEAETESRLRRIAALNGELHSWAKEYKLPPGEEVTFYEGLLHAVEEWKETESELDKTNRKISMLEEEQKQFEEEVASLLHKTGYPSNNGIPSLQEAVSCLLDFVRREETKEKDLNRKQEKLSSIKENISRLKFEKEALEEKKTALFKAACADDEEEFRRRAVQYERQQKMKDKERDLRIQMKTIQPDETELKRVYAALLDENAAPSAEQQEKKDKYASLETENDKVVERLAQIKREISHLEKDGKYEELQMEFSQMKEELQYLVKKWAVLATGNDVLKQVKAVYEKERQPEVIRETERLFSFLTDGRYTRVYAPLGEKRFILERNDGARFDPAEVSRGTCEMLYLAIRFALASKYRSGSSIPLFMDETFVNMDKVRRSRVNELLKKISESRQVLFFTCHEHLSEEVQSGNIHQLREETEAAAG